MHRRVEGGTYKNLLSYWESIKSRKKRLCKLRKIFVKFLSTAANGYEEKERK